MDSKLVIVLALCGLSLISTTAGQRNLQTPTLTGFPFSTQQSLNYIPPGSFSNATNGISNDLSRPWRLSRDVLPTLYKLHITPIMDADQPVGDQWTVPGTVTIEVTANASTSNVTLHKSQDLVISSIKVTDQSGTDIPVSNSDKYDAVYQFLHIELDRELVSGANYTISINFTAQIHPETELHGLYRSQYVDPTSNQPKWIGVTQMEAINARELFPCFDEPYFKAVFEVQISRRSEHTVLCNSKSTGVRLIPGVQEWVVETFERTPRMSTYLFATVISDFKYAKSSVDILPETEVRTYAPEHFIEQGRGNYSAEMGPVILKHYADFFNQAYPMNKMDLAGVPAFFFGAMENFGLNIYRESLLLYFDQEDTEAERQQITEVLAHELAHQWHGNRVTPAWWTHIWLNEGFADFLQHLGMEVSAPEFKPWDKITLTSQKVALVVDANLGFSHPLKIEEDKWITKDPMDWFDQLTYQKGGSLIYMMQGFLSREVLQEGLQRYHERMQFQAAEQDYLFEDLNVVATANKKIPEGVTMKEIMDTWTLQSGFPLLAVSINDNRTQITLSQSKYGDKDSDSQWVIPISLATRSNSSFSFEPELWLQSKETKIDVQPDDWVFANAGGSGYYRVSYDEELEIRILLLIGRNHSLIDYRSRSELIDDYFTFGWDRMKPIESALEYTYYLQEGKETEYIVWSVVLQHLKKSMNLFGSAGYLDTLKRYIVPGIVKTVEATGGINAISTATKGQEVLRHTLLLDWLCALGETSCVEYSYNLVDSWKNAASIKNNPVPKDLRPLVYCAAVSTDGSLAVEPFNFLYGLYKNGTDTDFITPKQKGILLKSFACAQDTFLIDQLLNGTIQDGFFNTKGEGIQFLRYLAGNVQARGLLMSYLKTHFDSLFAYFGSADVIEQSIAALGSFISSSEELTEIEKLVKDHDELTEEFFSQHRSVIQQNIAWIIEFGVPMQKYFDGMTSPTNPTDPTDPSITPTNPTDPTDPSIAPPTTTTPKSSSANFVGSGISFVLFLGATVVACHKLYL